ncbi:hypothetical protein [Coleofasciculus chthonoplastes]
MSMEELRSRLPFPQIHHLTRNKSVPHQSAMEAYPGTHITAQKTPFDTGN